MTLDQQLKFAYRQASSINKIMINERRGSFNGTGKLPDRVEARSSHYYFQKKFEFEGYGIVVRSDFEGGNLRYCELTSFSHTNKTLGVDVWLLSDGEIVYCLK